MFAPSLNIDLTQLQEEEVEEEEAPRRRAKGTRAPRPTAEEKKSNS